MNTISYYVFLTFIAFVLWMLVRDFFTRRYKYREVDGDLKMSDLFRFLTRRRWFFLPPLEVFILYAHVPQKGKEANNGQWVVWETKRKAFCELFTKESSEKAYPVLRNFIRDVYANYSFRTVLMKVPDLFRGMQKIGWRV